MILNQKIRTSLLAAVERQGCKPIARLVAVAPQTIGAAVRGEPLRERSWEKIERGLDEVFAIEVSAAELRKKIAPLVAQRGVREDIFAITAIDRAKLADLLYGKLVHPSILQKLTAAIPAIREAAAKRREKRCSLCDRPSERERCWRCCNKSSKQCQRCGHPHRDELSSAFCCLLVPESRGHCGWCGDDCERPFCGKPCSIAYHADRTKGLLGEGMTSESTEGAFRSSAWAP